MSDDMDEVRRQTTAIIAGLNATGEAGEIAAQLVIATAQQDAARLAVRTTALNAAATLTAGMSEAEAQADHDSREHDPDNPVSNVIALAGEFETWLRSDDRPYVPPTLPEDTPDVPAAAG